MLFPVVKALLGHYRRYPLQFFLVWLGLTLGVSLLIGVTTINHQSQFSYEQAQQTSDTRAFVSPDSTTHAFITPHQAKRENRLELGALSKAFNMNLQAIGLLAFLVGLFIFYQAMSLSFIQRQPLVGMLRQAGVSGIDLTKAIFIEILLLIVISWISGNFLGLLLANQLIPVVYAATGAIPLHDFFYLVDWEWCLYSLVLTIFGASFSCIWPLIRLLKAPPIRLTERLSLVRFAGAEFLHQAFIAIILGVIALVLYHKNCSPVITFTMLALILVSVALFTPFVVWKFFDFFSFSLPWVRTRWFFADAAASMSYRGVATMAFLIALATNIAADTVVGSFRHTTTHWLESRLAADFYFYAPASKSDSIGEWLYRQPEVKHVWQRWESDIITPQGMFELVSTGGSEAEAEAVTIKVAIPDYWYQLHHSKSVLISESTSSKLGYKPGDHIDLAEPMGKDWVVCGIYYDYGNPDYQILISDYQWQTHFPLFGDLIFATVLKPGQSRDSFRHKLENEITVDGDDIYDNHQIRRSVLDVFNKTFSVAGTLGNITLLIAVCGIFVATLAGEVARQRHLTLLRCFGVSASELIAIGGLQLLTFGVICLSIAIPLGVLLAQLVLDTTVKTTFGWTIPLHYFSGDFVPTIIWSLAALVCAGAIPVIRLVLRSPMIILRHSQ